MQAWEAQGTGLVVSERLINCPPQLAPPLQQNLFEEIRAAAEDEEEEQASLANWAKPSLRRAVCLGLEGSDGT